MMNPFTLARRAIGAIASLATPSPGEKTVDQKTPGVVSRSEIDAAGMQNSQYRRWRTMRRNPTVALARAVAQAPVKGARYSYEEDSAPAGAEEFVTGVIDTLWQELITDMLFALDYGWAPFEKVWALDADGRLIIDKMKPLTVDNTKIVVEKGSGAFGGLCQGKVTLPVQNSFVFSHDMECGNHYGRSLMLNIEKSHKDWGTANEKRAKFSSKVAGVIPILEYPEGKSRDENGSVIDNYQIAEKLLAALGSGNGIAMPNTLSRFAVDMAQAGVPMDKIKSWHLQLLETRGDHAAGFIVQMKHFESLMLRGWLVPERAATEGQYGTKAEAEVHGDIAINAADERLLSAISYINAYLVDPLLVFNFGPEAAGTVKVVAEGLNRAQQAFYRDLVKAILTPAANLDIAMELLDLEAIVEGVGLPAGDGDGLVVREVEKEPDSEAPDAPTEDDDDPATSDKPPKLGSPPAHIKARRTEYGNSFVQAARAIRERILAARGQEE